MRATASERLFASVFPWLNRHAEYAVLRNYSGFPSKNTSRDIDIILTRRTWKKIHRDLLALISGQGWKLTTLLRSDRLHTWVVAYQAPGQTEVVQWDFFFDTSVFGIRLMSAEELLRGRIYSGFLYHVAPEAEFLDKYLYDRAVGASYPHKYEAVRHAVEHSEAVKQKLHKLFGIEDAETCDRTGKLRLLGSALLFNLRRRPLGLCVGASRFLCAFIGNYMRSCTGFSIGFTGPDGSGKTTVIDLVIDRLGDVFLKAHTLCHFRPALFGNLGEVAHGAGLKKEVDRNYSQPHRGGKTGKISSLIRLAYYSVDYILGYFLRVKPQTRITRLVIFDRYYTDIIADSRRSRICLPYRMLYWYGRLFIPSLDYHILLTATAESILKRKRELDAEGINDINAKLEYLSRKKGYKLVMNESSPEVAADAILEHVFSIQHQKNLRRLNIK